MSTLLSAIFLILYHKKSLHIHIKQISKRNGPLNFRSFIVIMIYCTIRASILTTYFEKSIA